MRIEQTYIQKSKAFFHGAQALLTFIAGCLALAILTKDGETGGQVGYYFALVCTFRLSPLRCSNLHLSQCFLSIPALIYQVMVPLWSRAWRFANVYAYLSLDLLFSLLWFVAFIAVALWQSAGFMKGAQESKDEQDTPGSCAHFAFGSVSKCNVTKATVGMGVILFLLWCVTSGISIMMVIKYRRTGVVLGGAPGVGRRQNTFQQHDDASKDPWSTRIDEHDGDDMHEVDEERRKYGQQSDDDYQGLLNRANAGSPDTQTEHGAHPGRPMSFGSSTRARTPSVQTPAEYDDSSAPSALSPTGYAPTHESRMYNPFDDLAAVHNEQQAGPGARVQFPPGNY